jgi:hypothetical protein
VFILLSGFAPLSPTSPRRPTCADANPHRLASGGRLDAAKAHGQWVMRLGPFHGVDVAHLEQRDRYDRVTRRLRRTRSLRGNRIIVLNNLP